MTKSPDGIHLDKISGTAATMYVALFGACRKLAAPFRSSNPTWLRQPREHSERLEVARSVIAHHFSGNVRGMAAALEAKRQSDLLADGMPRAGESSVLLSDTTSMNLPPQSIDFVLTSPPYCTRIDYTAATRIELAVLSPLLSTTARILGKKMIGSTQVPAGEIEADPEWGPTCSRFLDALKKHPSKASAGYYYKTHLDYFKKMSRSIDRVTAALRPGAPAVFVVQDSYYKELHNNLPKIIAEIGENRGLRLKGQVDFHLRSMSDINPGRKFYRRPSGATESVLCFERDGAIA